MKFSKVLARTGILLFSALCLLVFQLANSILLGNTVALAQDEFPTVPPSDAEFEAPIEDLDPDSPSIAPLEPGDYLEFGDPRLPAQKDLAIEGGNEFAGYAPLNEEQSKYLMWYTDHQGIHYRVVDSSSQILFGTVDPLTGLRRENGFNKKVEQRETLGNELTTLQIQERGEARATDISFGFAGVLAVIGLGICAFATAGVCLAAAPVLAAGVVGGIGFGIRNSSDQATAAELKNAKIDEINELEDDLARGFRRPEPVVPDA